MNAAGLARLFAWKSIYPPKQTYGACHQRLSSQIYLVRTCLRSIPVLRHGPPSLLRPMATTSADQPYTDFFRYTGGRWLWNEDQELRDRFTPFNVPELQRVAANSVGAQRCVAMTKLAEGSDNKTFKLVMDNGTTAIARIPHPIAGPKYYTTASEVATMDLVRGLYRPLELHHQSSCRL